MLNRLLQQPWCIHFFHAVCKTYTHLLCYDWCCLLSLAEQGCCLLLLPSHWLKIHVAR